MDLAIIREIAEFLGDDLDILRMLSINRELHEWATALTSLLDDAATVEQLDDPRASFAGFGTFFYGPLLLAGLTTDQQLIVGNKTVDEVLVRNSSSVLSFEATPAAVRAAIVAAGGVDCSGAEAWLEHCQS